MLNPIFLLLRRGLLAFLLLPLHGRADGLSDLKEALNRYSANSPIKAVVDAKTWNRNGEGKDAEERSGQAIAQVEEGGFGLRIQYSKETLSRLAADEQLKEKDGKAKTPTLSAINALNISELRQMGNAAPGLMRLLEKTTFKAERAEAWNGKSARVLTFELGMSMLSEKDRKYVKKHDGNLDIWIAADGTPLASRMHQSISGRAYVVVSFDMTNDEDMVFSTLGDRLVALRKEARSSGSGAGEHGESRTTRTLVLQP